VGGNRGSGNETKANETARERERGAAGARDDSPKYRCRGAGKNPSVVASYS
jgi:hypothetical protein